MSDVAAYHVFVWGGDFIIMSDVAVYVFVCATHTQIHSNNEIPPTHKYMICCHITHNNEIFIILTHDFSKEQYVLPEDDNQYATET